MIEILLLAVALSMDAFAVSIGLGARPIYTSKKSGFIIAFYFGLFQAIMPLIGYLGGKNILNLVKNYADWIAFGLLFVIGLKMIYESIKNSNHSDNSPEIIQNITQKALFILAIATSIDAMAAGFTLNLLPINPFLACTIIGVITFIFSWIGVFIGEKTGAWLSQKAGVFGGIVLILIAFKTLLF